MLVGERAGSPCAVSSTTSQRWHFIVGGAKSLERPWHLPRPGVCCCSRLLGSWDLTEQGAGTGFRSSGRRTPEARTPDARSRGTGRARHLQLFLSQQLPGPHFMVV